MLYAIILLSTFFFTHTSLPNTQDLTTGALIAGGLGTAASTAYKAHLNKKINAIKRQPLPPDSSPQIKLIKDLYRKKQIASRVQAGSLGLAGIGALGKIVTKYKNKPAKNNVATNRTLPDFSVNQHQITHHTLDQITHHTLEEIEKTASHYGYKTANLHYLKKHADTWTSPDGFSIVVPDFNGISSADIIDFLTTHARFDIHAKWNTVCRSIDKTNALKKFKLDLAVALHTFIFGAPPVAGASEEVIVKAFTEPKTSTKTLEEFTQLFPTDGKDCLSILIKNQAEHFMVRSTGKEDSDTNANAGGNLSVVNVPAEYNHLLCAISRVILSYFSDTSFAQRKIGDDSTLFTSDALFMPILLQVMIGEKDEKAIPKSGVIFTAEPNGQTAALQKTGIIIIQGAPGHAELVVTGQSAVDSFIINGQTINSIIRRKPSRLTPDPIHKTLASKHNSDEVAAQSTFTNYELRELAAIARKVELAYQKPMDIEFTLMPNNTLYLLQARPIIYTTPTTQPTYTFLETLPADAEIIEGTIVGSAEPAVQELASKTAVLIGNEKQESLKSLDALNLFLTLSDTEQAAISLICVTDLMPATSHQATTFRRAGKAVICLPKIAILKLKKWITNKTNGERIFFDPQQELIIKTDEKLKVNGGFIRYPLPQCMSVLRSDTIQREEIALRHKKILKELGLTETQFTAKSAESRSTAKDSATKELKTQITLIKTGSTEAAKAGLTKLYCIIHQALRPEKASKKLAPLLKSLYDSILAIIPTLNIATAEPEFLSKRLFAIHFLETLLWQHPEPSACLYTDSLRMALLVKRQLKEVSTKSIPTPNSALTLEQKKMLSLFSRFFLNDELKTSWGAFVDNISDEKMPQATRTKIGDMIRTLNSLQLMPLWLSTSFAAIAKDPNQADELIKAFDSDQATLVLIQAKRKLLAQIDLEKFENPDSFVIAWKDFIKTHYAYFISDGFIKIFQETYAKSKTNKCSISYGLIIKLMHTFIAVFDSAIKTVSENKKKLFILTGQSPEEIRLINRLYKALNELSGTNITHEKLVNFQTISEELIAQLTPGRDEVDKFNKIVETISKEISSRLEAAPGGIQYSVSNIHKKCLNHVVYIFQKTYLLEDRLKTIQQTRDHLYAFYTMLQSYHEILARWHGLTNTIPAIKQAEQILHATSGFEIKNWDKSQLTAPNFNVQTCMIDGLNDPFYNNGHFLPDSLEALFVWTHQNILAFLAQQSNSLINLELLLPPFMNRLKERAHELSTKQTAIESEQCHLTITNIDIKPHTVVTDFKYSQRQHAATLSILWGKQEIEITIKFYGGNEWHDFNQYFSSHSITPTEGKIGRWEQCKHYVSHIPDIKLMSSAWDEVSFTGQWQCAQSDTESFIKIITTIKELSDLTMSIYAKNSLEILRKLSEENHAFVEIYARSVIISADYNPVFYGTCCTKPLNPEETQIFEARKIFKMNCLAQSLNYLHLDHTLGSDFSPNPTTMFRRTLMQHVTLDRFPQQVNPWHPTNSQLFFSYFNPNQQTVTNIRSKGILRNFTLVQLAQKHFLELTPDQRRKIIAFYTALFTDIPGQLITEVQPWSSAAKSRLSSLLTLVQSYDEKNTALQNACSTARTSFNLAATE